MKVKLLHLTPYWMGKCVFLNRLLLDNSDSGGLVDLEVIQDGGLLFQPLHGGLLHQPAQDLPLELLVQLLLSSSLHTTCAKG